MKIEYYPNDGKYNKNGKKVWWYWEFYHLPHYRKWRLSTPFGGFNFYY